MEARTGFRTLCCSLLLLASLVAGQTPLVEDEKPTNGSLIVSDNVEKGSGSKNISVVTGVVQDEEVTDDDAVPDRVMPDLQNKLTTRLRAATVLHTPYMMKGPGSSLVGLVPDILHHLEKRLALTFDLYLAPDGKYGTRDVNGSWDGMMGELVKRVEGDTSGADVAAAPMTVTSERHKYVSFLNPFQHGGLVGLMRKPHLDDRERNLLDSYINLMHPLSAGVWCSMLIGCVVVATVLWLLNLMNPYEWGGRYNIGRATQAAAESFNFSGSVWFAFTTLQWQGFDRMPRSSAAKVLSVFWFVFVSVSCIMYTASVVNHLVWASTKHGRDLTSTPFIDLNHLASAHDQQGYDYGLVGGGDPYKYLMDAARGGQFDLMRDYWQYKGQDNLVLDTSQGVSRAREGKYVFITERMTAQFFINQRPCDLTMIDKPVGSRSYAIALSKTLDKTLEDGMRAVILQMMESGEMEELEKRWFKERSQCWDKNEAEETLSALSYLIPTSPKQVSISMFWGPLTILVVGIVLSVVVSIAEVMFYRYKGRYTQNNRNGGHRLGAGEDEVPG